MVLTPLDDYTGRSTYFVGDIDPTISKLCRMLLRPGDVAFDIGANIGVVTTLMARLVGATGRVRPSSQTRLQPICCSLPSSETQSRMSTCIDLPWARPKGRFLWSFHGRTSEARRFCIAPIGVTASRSQFGRSRRP